MGHTWRQSCLKQSFKGNRGPQGIPSTLCGVPGPAPLGSPLVQLLLPKLSGMGSGCSQCSQLAPSTPQVALSAPRSLPVPPAVPPSEPCWLCCHHPITNLSLPAVFSQLFGFVYACYVSKVFLEEEDSCKCLGWV